MTPINMDLEVDPRETTGLRQLAQSCAKQLQQLAQDEETREANVDSRDGFWASRQSTEFNLWCSKIGVNSAGLRSIDVRLKDVPEICKLLLHLLQSLHRDLADFSQQANGVSRSADETGISHSDSDSGSDASSLVFDSLSSSEGSQSSNIVIGPVQIGGRRKVELRQHIGDTIDRLQGQARRIERAGAQHRRKRVEVYREKERPKQIYEGFKKLGMWKANEQFKSASQIVKERMAESFARRRIRFEYLKEHQKKRAVDLLDLPEENTTGPSEAKNGDIKTAVAQKKEVPKKLNFTGTTYPQDQRTLFSATVNTRYDLPPERKTHARAESVRSIALRHPGFPPPPQIQEGKFQCPYCLLEFRAREAEKGHWSQHVMQDFEPYFCTFDVCEAPFDIPNSFEDLLDHLQSHLPIRHHVDEPDGEHREYLESEFEGHVKSHGEVSEETMVTMKEASRRKGAFLFDSCPFCGGYPDVLEKRFPDPDTMDAQKELRKHIKQHMQEIALFLPPYRSDIFDEDDDLKGSDVTHRRSKNDQTLGDPDDFDMFCHREECDCKDSGKSSWEFGPNTTETARDKVDLLPERLSGYYGHSESLETQTNRKTQHRWICCLCGNDYNADRGVDCIRCNRDKCRSCLTYEVDLSHEGDWSHLLEDTSVYDRSEVTDEELLKDERLQSFILCFAFRELQIIDGQVVPPAWATTHKRATCVLRLGSKDEQLWSRMDHTSNLLAATVDGALIIRFMVGVYFDYIKYDSNALRMLWPAAQNGQLEDLRRLLTKEFGPQFDAMLRSSPHMIFSQLDDNHENEDIDSEGYAKKELDPAYIQYDEKHPGPDKIHEGYRTEAFYKDTPVWIEWKRHECNAQQLERIKHITEAQIKLLKDLNGLDQAEHFRILRCLGYLREKDYNLWGFVFEKPKPSPIDEGEEVVSLSYLIIRADAHMPALFEKLRFMGRLYEAIARFHAEGFVYYGLCSDNILFFTHHDTMEASIAQPYLSGLAFSGIRLENYMTEPHTESPWFDIYRHPTCVSFNHALRNQYRYEESHDLYSLGIVFLEIAHWRPISEIMGFDRSTVQESQILEVKNRLLSTADAHILQFAKSTVGATVESFIRACIEDKPGRSLIEKFQHVCKAESGDLDLPIEHGEHEYQTPVSPNLVDEVREDNESAHEHMDLELKKPQERLHKRDANNIYEARSSSEERAHSTDIKHLQSGSQSSQDRTKILSNPGTGKRLSDSTEQIEEIFHLKDHGIATLDGSYARVSSEEEFLHSEEEASEKGPLGAGFPEERTSENEFEDISCTESRRTSLPSTDAQPSVIKSILKNPTPKFPEDPEPIREGAARLSDSTKGKEIPAGARWTKIDRRLVNPAALDEAKERFEERLDCVIVLRVLTKEEITKLAERTREIRAERESESLVYPADEKNRYQETDRTLNRKPGVRGRHYYQDSSDDDSDARDRYRRPRGREIDADDDYEYTDAASMYRDTEPLWRRPRGEVPERNAARFSARELGPPPSTRGFDKINDLNYRARMSSPEVGNSSSPYTSMVDERPTSLLDRSSERTPVRDESLPRIISPRPRRHAIDTSTISSRAYQYEPSSIPLSTPDYYMPPPRPANPPPRPRIPHGTSASTLSKLARYQPGDRIMLLNPPMTQRGLRIVSANRFNFETRMNEYQVKEIQASEHSPPSRWYAENELGPV